METRYAIEMCFAQDTNEVIRALWSRLREEGLFTPDQLGFDPHVTLAVLTRLEEDLGREIVDEMTVEPRTERELAFREYPPGGRMAETLRAPPRDSGRHDRNKVEEWKPATQSRCASLRTCVSFVIRTESQTGEYPPGGRALIIEDADIDG